MNFNKAEFVTSFGSFSQLPPPERVEIAFSGRSNVGKSSLINKLFNRKNLARVSAVPGKTATINFYKADNIFFVDLPGYGYAQRSAKTQAQIDRIIRSYVLQREQMACLFVLLDSRHAPQAIDLQFIEWLGENGVPFALVFTKADKLGVNVLKANVRAYLAKLEEQWEELPPHFVTSSERTIGRDELLNYIESINRSISD